MSTITPFDFRQNIDYSVLAVSHVRVSMYKDATQRALLLKWHFLSAVLQHSELYTSISPYFSKVAYTHQPPGACRHWQLRRILTGLFSTHMSAAAVLEAKGNISAENMLLIVVFEEKLDSSGNWMTPREHCDIVFLCFFFFFFKHRSVWPQQASIGWNSFPLCETPQQLYGFRKMSPASTQRWTFKAGWTITLKMQHWGF